MEYAPWSSEFTKACSVTAAHFLTLDFTALSDERSLWQRGFLLEDRLRGESIKVFSLIELEIGVLYTTPHGNSLVRKSQTEALLNDKISLAVDLCEATVSPRASFSEIAADDLSLIHI